VGLRPDVRGDLALDALEEAICERQEETLVHHSDRGVQYLSIRYTERLAEAGIEPSVGSRGDSYDNALAESVIGLFKTEVIRRRGPWRGLEDVEFATLEWVWWFNTIASSSRSATFPRSSMKRISMVTSRIKPRWRHSRSQVCEEPGAVQC
jgi:transposase InsO family protein